MATIKISLDLRVAKKDGSYPLKLSLFHKGTTVINMGISVTEDQWNGTAVTGHPKSKIFNKVIHNKKVLAESIILNLSNSGKLARMTLKQLRDCIENNDKDTELIEENPVYKVKEHFNRYIEMTKNIRTKQIYRETLDKITAYSPEITFEDLNISWLKSFDLYLAVCCKTNTRAIHMRNIRAVFNDAINEELISQNLYPFRKFKIKKEKTIKRSLTVDQIKLLRDYPVEKHQERYRDLFMLIFYLIGINLIDLLHLEEIRNGRIEYRRAKTGALYSIFVLPEAQQIIDKYRGSKYLINVLDSYSNYKDFAARMNENLKTIGKLEWVSNNAKEEKFVKRNKKKISPLFPDITIYHARHSWATIAASLDIPKETISAGLGHEIGSETTSIYIDFDMNKVDQANRDVLACLKK